MVAESDASPATYSVDAATQSLAVADRLGDVAGAEPAARADVSEVVDTQLPESSVVESGRHVTGTPRASDGRRVLGQNQP